MPDFTAPLALWGSTSSVLTYLHLSRSADTLTSSSRSALWRLRNSDPEDGQRDSESICVNNQREHRHFQRLPRSDRPCTLPHRGNEQLVRLAFRHSPSNGQRQGIVKRPTKIESSLDAASQMRDNKRFAHHFTIRPNLSVAICTECYTDDAICASRRRSPFEKDNRSMWSVANRNH